MKKIAIIGAGIGGLTAAIALRKRGFNVELFESTPTFKKAGFGINLAINAMQVYQRLGIYDDIIAHGHVTECMNVRTQNFALLGSSDMMRYERKYGVRSVAIHRASLHEILLKHLVDVKIHLNKSLRNISQSNGTVKLSFADGSTHNATIVIGADGIHSMVRQSIIDDSELRNAEQICWRGISAATIDFERKGALNELWGKGNRFGFIHINNYAIYWFALINNDRFANQPVNLIDVFSDYHPIVKEIIAETPQESILCNEISDLKPLENWYVGNVCLIGDAVHATTPNMGQGAAQAVESAMVLSICLSEEKSVENAFCRYQHIRKSKANHITKKSWRIGKMAQLANTRGIALRNMALRLAPAWLIESQNRKIFKLNY